MQPVSKYSWSRPTAISLRHSVNKATDCKWSQTRQQHLSFTALLSSLVGCSIGPKPCGVVNNRFFQLKLDLKLTHSDLWQVPFSGFSLPRMITWSSFPTAADFCLFTATSISVYCNVTLLIQATSVHCIKETLPTTTPGLKTDLFWIFELHNNIWNNKKYSDKHACVWNPRFYSQIQEHSWWYCFNVLEHKLFKNLQIYKKGKNKKQKCKVINSVRMICNIERA